MKNISLALINYESAHGTFPPAYVADKDGKPLYSWRVLILPYIERGDIYEAFHLDEPWNSPHNLPLSQLDLDIFHCPSDNESKPGETNYMMVVGPGMISEGAKSLGLKDIKDGYSNTILLVEMSGENIHWAEPRDLNVLSKKVAINDPKVPGPRSMHPGGASVSFVDGHVSFLDESLDPKTLHALMTPNGHELINDDEY